MKFTTLLTVLGASAGLAATAAAQSYAPATNFANVIFAATLTGATGGANADASFSDFFSASGQDYSISPSGAYTNPVAYTYASTGADTATITEGSLAIALTFTSATAGTFVATYSPGVTQTGTFTLNTETAETPITDVSTLLPLDDGATATTGFYIGGSVPRTVLIRAVGPGLQPFGVAGFLAAPQLTLWSQGSATPMQTGTSTTANLENVYSAVGAFALPVGSADQALVATLTPGGYTAMVSGGAGSGKVLIEVYFLD